MRLGPGPPKALRTLGGEPLLVHAVRALASSPDIDVVVVAAPADDVPEVREMVSDCQLAASVSVVAGGDTRQLSVAGALSALTEDVDIVLVHDAARPLAPVELVTRVAAAVRGGADAVVPALPVVDTIAEVEPIDADSRIVRNLDRAALRAVQTPQGFRRSVLARAHRSAADTSAADPSAADGELLATDDAGMVRRLGVDVLVVAGAEDAFKVTRPIDLLLAEAVLARRGSTA